MIQIKCERAELLVSATSPHPDTSNSARKKRTFTVFNIYDYSNRYIFNNICQNINLAFSTLFDINLVWEVSKTRRSQLRMKVVVAVHIIRNLYSSISIMLQIINNKHFIRAEQHCKWKSLSDDSSTPVGPNQPIPVQYRQLTLMFRVSRPSSWWWLAVTGGSK